MNFEERFCAKFNVRPVDFEKAVMRRTLSPLARWLRPILNLNPEYFAPDREFIRSVGQIRSIARFRGEAQDFTDHPDNRKMMRRAFRLRISRRRMRALVAEVMRE